MQQTLDFDDDGPAVVIEPTEAEERKAVVIELIGKRYKVRPPKTSFAMKYALAGDGEDASTAVKLTVSWVKAAFQKDDAQEVIDRLQDPDDLLDLQHIMKLIEALVAKVSGNPTS